MFQLKDKKLLLAVLTVAIVWGTTFLGIRIAVGSIPPWYVTGIRQSLAALVLLGVLLSRGELRMLPGRDLITQFVLSALMLVGANGLMTVAEQHLSSSLASLISSSSPILVFLLSVFLGMQKFSLRALLGVVLGFGGIVLIFWNSLSDFGNSGYRSGIIAMLFMVLCWAAGTVYSKTIHRKEQNLFLNLFYQFAFAGVVQLILAFIFEKRPDFASWTWESLTAVVYLAIFGSVLAYFAFNYALKKISATQISILSYINTVIAILLGWLLLHENITWQFILAAAMIITGVFITNTAKKG